MKKTALAELITYLTEVSQVHGAINIFDAIDEAKALLQKEREQMIDSFVNGESSDNPEVYFDNNYTQK